MTRNWTRVDISCGADRADDLGAELAESFGASVEFIPEGVRIYFDSAVFGEKRPVLDRMLESASNADPGGGKIEWTFSEIPDEDWSETWKAHFKPLRVGRRFLVTPTWEPVRPGPEDLVIRIDPGRAFGTGHHETTRLCLEWLEAWAEKAGGLIAAASRSHSPRGEDIAAEGRSHSSGSKEVADEGRSHRASHGASPGTLLDVGTGSGILAIGAALLGFENILGIDNDPEAIEVAAPNIELNGLSGKIRVLCASPLDIDEAYDVVISNIMALPLIRMSGTLVSRVKDGGRLVLSGILAEQAEEVRAEYGKRGAALTASRADGEWVLLDFAVSKRISHD